MLISRVSMMNPESILIPPLYTYWGYYFKIYSIQELKTI